MPEQKPKFQVLYSEEADAFLAKQSEKVKAKILYNGTRASYINDPKLFKKLENTDIWEFRTLFDSIQYRLLAFWDKRRRTKHFSNRRAWFYQEIAKNAAAGNPACTKYKRHLF